jgi:hypothetical protein
MLCPVKYDSEDGGHLVAPAMHRQLALATIPIQFGRGDRRRQPSIQMPIQRMVDRDPFDRLACQIHFGSVVVDG